MSKNITLKDIARLANVSPTAVSFYLNGKAKDYNLSEKTCEKIRQVITQYNYQPNFHARAINARKTYLVGMLLNNLVGSFYARLVWGVEQELAKNGYHMVFAETGNDPEKELAALKFLAQTGVDGCIIAPCHNEKTNPGSFDTAVLRGKPIISVLYGSAPTPVFDTDHVAGVSAVAEQFLNAGHRKLAYFGMKLPELHDHYNRERYNVFNHCVMQANCQAVDAYDDLSDMVENYHKYSGIFCYSDSYAIQLILKFQKIGVRVPEDISIAGYGEDEIASFFDFKLTTIHENKDELGRLAAQQILRKINDPDYIIPGRIRMKPKLLKGNTVAAPKKI